MKLSILVLFLVSFVFSTQSNGQTYDIDSYDGQTITTCSGKFTDSRSGSSHYYNNEDYTVTFCSGTDQLLNFNFGASSTYTNERIDPTDTLYIYDGASTSDPLIAAITGNPSNSDKLSFFGETSTFDFLSPSDCITFRFVSDGSDNQDGWEAIISCVDKVSCNDNPDVSDLFGAAPYVCNFNGYCGVTSQSHGAEYPTGLSGGGSCPTLFGGTIENNSWLKFEAASTTVDFDFEVSSCSSGSGIQVAVFEYDGTTFTRKTDCSWSDGSHMGNFSISATSLTIGETYYIMVDGNAGSICEYSINSSNSSSISTLSAGEDISICSGDITTLVASAPSSISSFNWTWDDGSGGPLSAQSIDVSPTETTEYILTTDDVICSDSGDTIVVQVDDCSLPIELADFYAQQSNTEITIEWSTYNEVNNNYFIIEKSTNGEDFYGIATLEGNKNSNSLLSYTIKDSKPVEGHNYYRLSQVDFDGEKHVYETILGEFTKDQIKNNFFYSKNEEAIMIQNLEAGNTVYIYDFYGKLLYQTSLTESQSKLSLPRDILAKQHSVIVSYINKNTVHQQKIIIK